jgi:hypothetical protein
MTDVYSRKRQPTWRERLVAGLLTVVTAVLGLLDYVVLTSFVLHPLMWAFAAPFSWQLWDTVSVIVLILIWLVLVYMSAYFYQKAVTRNTLWRLFGTITLFQIVLPSVAAGIVRLLLLVQPASHP